MSDQSTEKSPSNNLVWAILSILVCQPLGIVSIIKAANVNTLWAQGQHEAARQASADAKKYALWGIGISILLVVLYVLFFILLGLGSAILRERGN